MGGIDKGWVEYQSQPLIQYALDNLAPQVNRIIISANRELDRYQSLGYPIVQDQYTDFAGPLAGIHAGLAAADTEWVLTIPVDSPYLPDHYAKHMIKTQITHQVDVVYASDGEYPQPVFLLARTSLAPTAAQMLSMGDGKIMRWVRARSYAKCILTDPRMFENKNRPEDLSI